MKKNILISTLGASWKIIPETVGAFFYNDSTDFYGKNPNEMVCAFRESTSNVLKDESIDELWLISTDQEGLDEIDTSKPRASLSVKGMLRQITEWRDSYVPTNKLIIRTFVLSGVNDIDSKESVDKFHNLALHVLFKSKLYANGGKRIVSLACGRKTMSADIQDAAYCFGCDMMMHVTAPGKVPDIVLNNQKSGLNEEEQSQIFPVELKPFPASDLFNDWYNGETAINFDLPLDGNAKFSEWTQNSMVYFYDSPMEKVSFLKKVEEKREAARHFYSSYWSHQQYSYDNFPILYTLSIKSQKSLQDFRIGIQQDLYTKDLKLLKGLPKADLHCHLGGVLSISEIIDVASTLENELAAKRAQNPKFSKWNLEGPKSGQTWKNWRNETAKELDVSPLMIVTAFVLQFKEHPEKLDEIVYGPQAHNGKDLRNEKEFVAIAPIKQDAEGKNILDLTEYEALGDLQGSGLLTHEKTLRRTVQILFDNARECNQKYLEIRCSPINYGKDSLTPQQVVEIILDEMEKAEPSVKSSMIFIASRHGKEEDITKSVDLYKRLKNQPLFKKFFRGFDVAGNESQKSPRDIRKHFEDILGDCLNVTVHAGETMPAQNIWEAVYCLNAERIGHGLTLIDRREDLIPKFRDRRIGIEMCPSSNYQVVGYTDNYYNQEGLKNYPLRDYLDNKLLVCINTDNPGISRTDMVQELLKAARLTRNGLSIWDILALLYNSFHLAFLPYNEKLQLLNNMNNEVKLWLDKNLNRIENGTIYEE